MLPGLDCYMLPTVILFYIPHTGAVRALDHQVGKTIKLGMFWVDPALLLSMILLYQFLVLASPAYDELGPHKCRKVLRNIWLFVRIRILK